jgi:excisionase family DNA binding protein
VVLGCADLEALPSRQSAELARITDAGTTRKAGSALEQLLTEGALGGSTQQGAVVRISIGRTAAAAMGDDDLTKPLVVRPIDAAILLGCGHNKIYELINSGELESSKIGARTRLITMRSIEKLLGIGEPM